MGLDSEYSDHNLPRDLKIITLARNSSNGNVLNGNNLHGAKAFPQRELLREVEETDDMHARLIQAY